MVPQDSKSDLPLITDFKISMENIARKNISFSRITYSPAPLDEFFVSNGRRWIKIATENRTE